MQTTYPTQWSAPNVSSWYTLNSTWFGLQSGQHLTMLCVNITKPGQWYFELWHIVYTPISHPVSLKQKLDLIYQVFFWFCHCQILLPCSWFTSNLERYNLTNSTTLLQSYHKMATMSVSSFCNFMFVICNLSRTLTKNKFPNF